MPLSQPASAPPSPSQSVRSTVLIALILFLGTLLLYSPALNNAFLNYDDPAYVTSNPRVLEGLSWQNLRWAITATVEANWHPLTWISHMADAQLFGINPRGHHAVNILLHGVNVVLLFLVLWRSTGFLYRSAIVAGFFAVHPLNVECVAWVSERKSLLAMLFLLLALLAYGRYSRQRSLGRYMAVVGFFVLGLTTKPMIVTFPVLLLLWDFWPLRRFAASGTTPGGGNVVGLLAEKIPLFFLSAASSVITLFAQRSGGALGDTLLLPFRLRLENAVYSYAAYLLKGIWPLGLAVFYPHPEESLSLWKVFAAGLLILLITALAWINRVRSPYLLTAWIWYLVAILPMIGIIQVGRQAMADRYAYLPFVGLFIIAVWGTAELFQRVHLSTVSKTMIAAAVLVTYAFIAFLQIQYWHDSYTLFSHALAVTSRNGIAEDNFGAALMEMGRPDLALPHFEAAVRYIPPLSTAHYNLGVLAQRSNRAETARFEYELALQYSSDSTEIAQAHTNLGFLLLDSDPKFAIAHFTAALAMNPEKANAMLGRGMAEYRLADFDAAIHDLTLASRTPHPLAYYWLGRALEAKGQTQPAITAYQIALQLAPTMADTQQRLNSLTHSSLH